MATSAYWGWVNAGRPWRKARPVAQMEAWARANGIAVLGTIGNEAHLQASFPEDHTPFSFTAWPVRLPGYIVTAIDLANERGLGAAILRDARAGRLKWLKYMNVAGRSYSYADGFRAGRSNSDQHVHLSIFSDEVDTSIGGYDPLATGEDDMDLTDKVDLTDGKGGRWSFGDAIGKDSITVKAALGYAAAADFRIRNQVLAELAAARKRDEAILAAVRGDDSADIIAAINQRSAEDAARDEEAAVAAQMLLERLDGAVTTLTELRELVQAAATGQLAADEVVRLIGERLSAPSGDGS